MPDTNRPSAAQQLREVAAQKEKSSNVKASLAAKAVEKLHSIEPEVHRKPDSL